MTINLVTLMGLQYLKKLTLSNSNPAILSFVIISHYKINFLRVQYFLKTFCRKKTSLKIYSVMKTRMKKILTIKHLLHQLDTFFYVTFVNVVRLWQWDQPFQWRSANVSTEFEHHVIAELQEAFFLLCLGFI